MKLVTQVAELKILIEEKMNLSHETSTLRALAIYLPQFHPIKENNEWWGEGFTEWTNVAKAQPRFPGHYQPQLPADLGFYDLRLAEARQAQANLAREYGIHGFCYYHYWFTGRRILERPFEEVLNSGQPDFPFCLCWANENWTRRWDGQDQQVLLKQDYSEEDDLNHIRYLAKVFSNPLYIKINNKPVFIIYRLDLFPDVQRTIETWRQEAVRIGIGDIYLIAVERNGHNDSVSSLGFDAAMQFEPNGLALPRQFYGSFYDRMLNKLKIKQSPFVRDKIFSYEDYVENAIKQKIPDYKRYPCITPAWDNSARRKNNSTILHGSTPAIYERWLSHVISEFRPYSKDENLIFINAWNEWAEGNHLEPCQKWGRQYLEATKRALLTDSISYSFA